MELPDPNKIKKGKPSIAPLQPFTLASFRTWGSDRSWSYRLAGCKGIKKLSNQKFLLKKVFQIQDAGYRIPDTIRCDVTHPDL